MAARWSGQRWRKMLRRLLKKRLSSSRFLAKKQPKRAIDFKSVARSPFSKTPLLQRHLDDHALIRSAGQIERSAGYQHLAVGLIMDPPAEGSLAALARIPPPALVAFVLVDLVQDAAPRFHVVPVALRVLPLHH